jgi:hypothetical protein
MLVDIYLNICLIFNIVATYHPLVAGHKAPQAIFPMLAYDYYAAGDFLRAVFGFSAPTKTMEGLMLLQNSRASESSRDMIKAGLVSAGLLMLTAGHHFYGGIIYHTDFRFHIAMFGAIGTLVVLGILLLVRMPSSQVVNWLAYWTLALFVAFAAGVFGIWEGGYNHVLKNIIYFSNARHLMSKLYPPSFGFEMPGNVFFEVSGVLEFVCGLVAGYFFFRSLRTRLTQRKISSRVTKERPVG